MTAIGYTRVSTTGQVEDGVSLDAQRAKLEAWAALHDEPELIIFEDAGISGSSISQRPGFGEVGLRGEGGRLRERTQAPPVR